MWTSPVSDSPAAGTAQRVGHRSVSRRHWAPLPTQSTGESHKPMPCSTSELGTVSPTFTEPHVWTQWLLRNSPLSGPRGHWSCYHKPTAHSRPLTAVDSLNDSSDLPRSLMRETPGVTSS